MEFKPDMNLLSESGYEMPFESPEQEPVVIYLPYGKQIHPKTQEEFWHNGIDLKIYHPQTKLFAVADGTICAIGSDPKKGFYITTQYEYRYGGKKNEYRVTYAHLSEARANLWQKVKAGTNIATCGAAGFLHLDVTFNGEEIDPQDFIEMLYLNYNSFPKTVPSGESTVITNDIEGVRTPFDGDEKELSSLMSKDFFKYLGDLITGRYTPPQQHVDSLRNAFLYGREKGFYGQTAPSLVNPLGLTQAASTLISQVQSILSTMFLEWEAQVQRIFLSSMNENEKKKMMEGTFLNNPYQ